MNRSLPTGRRSAGGDGETTPADSGAATRAEAGARTDPEATRTDPEPARTDPTGVGSVGAPLLAVALGTVGPDAPVGPDRSDGSDGDPAAGVPGVVLRENVVPGDVGLPRVAGLLLVVAGVVHLLAPRTLLWTARVAYRFGLRVRFRPRAGAPRRVRLVGVGMVLAGAHLLYHGGVRPRWRRD